MMFKKKLLASAIATAALSVGMVGSASATAISETSVGQVLLGDMYLARSSDYSTTDLRVINTSLTNAVKAKLVFRSKKHSDECRDMILYLTPGDVAYVTVRLNSAGQPEVWSDDDSILATRNSNGQVTFASQVTGGVTFPMVAPRTEPAADTCAQGHFEVVGIYAVTGTVTGLTNGRTVTIRQGMSKHDLINVFDTPKATLNAAGNNITNNGGALGGADYSSRVRLKGNVEIASSGDRLMAPMTALRDGDNVRTALTITHAVTNPLFDADIGSETLIGNGFGNGAPLQPVDMVTDFEGALTTARLFNTYVAGGTNFEITFPTKYRHIVSGRYSGAGATYSTPFQTNGSVQYSSQLYDNQERGAPGSVTDLCVVSPCNVTVNPGMFLIHEVNFEALTGTSTWNPTTGWFDLSLIGRAGLDNLGYTWTAAEGVPATGYTHFYKAGLTQSVISPMGR